MHPYSLDTQARKYVYFSLAIISFALPQLFAEAIGSVLTDKKIAYPFSVGATFTVLHSVFDHWIWKKLYLWLKIPDLNGRWKAEGISSYTDPDTGERCRFVMEYTIKQTFTRMEVFGETDKSTSRSTMSSLEIDHAVPIFRYSFENTPKNTADIELQRHPGLIELRVNTRSELAGDYFSGKHRLRFGELTLTKA